MPGLSLKYDVSEAGMKAESNSDYPFFQALNSTIYDKGYKAEILMKEDPYTIACTRYPGYPINFLQDNNYWVCIEGRIYNKKASALQKEINHLMNYVFDSKSDVDKHEKTIINWLLESDGDFIIYALNKITKDFVIVNDVLGRLPLYYYHDKNKGLIVSREARILSELIHHKDNASRYDKMGIAQYLLFYHTFGKRTIFSDMYRLEPASILRIYNINSEIKIDTLFCFNFEEKKYDNESIEKSAQRLVSLFSEACKNRANDNGRNLISLSGGFDSRAVASSFHKNKIPGNAVTFYLPGQTTIVGSTPETQIARQIATLLGLGWQSYAVDPKGSHLLSFLMIKNGLSPLAYSYLLPFLEVLKDGHSPSDTTIFTGHGGDIIFADIKPWKRRRKHKVNLDHLVRHIIHGRGYFSLSDVAALLRVDEEQIMIEIKRIFSLYPEKNQSYKYVHYLFYETTFKIDHEAEDIYRYYFWSVSPFYSVPFFEYAINCVGKNNSPGDLYRQFLFALSPSASAINNSNWGCSILSKKYRLLQFLQSLNYKYPKLKKIVRRIAKKTLVTEGDPRIKAIRSQIKNCEEISGLLCLDRIEEILKNYKDHTRVGIDNLFTITSLIETASGDTSRLQKNHND
ncbi:MAG TPA: asparagine synthase-related protein [Nitrososphaeraceae archaeon]|jgi:asparagine synthase (glutamine-hydrolysing)|nr:asparagine synthase-related protein [Nitrososphaeraceae archaeon]